MRRFALLVAILGAACLAFGIANVASHWAGGVVTVLALISAALLAGLVAELWYVSRRIERAAGSASADAGDLNPEP